MNSRRHLLAVGGVVFSLALAHPAFAQVIADSPTLPPAGGKYKAENDVSFDMNVVLKNKIIGDFSNVRSKKTDKGDQKKTFDAKLKGRLVDKKNDNTMKPFTLNGSLKKKVFGRTSQKQTGKFKVEVKKKDFKGSIDKFGKLALQESANLRSTGQVEIREIDNGYGLLEENQQFEIRNFFDVFTEASRNESDFVPAEGPAMFSLIPEPSGLVLFALGLAGLAVFAWKRRLAA